MTNKTYGSWIIAVISVLLIASLILGPTFRTAAQKPDKPATTEKNNTPGNKSSKNSTGSKNGSIDQKDLELAMKELERAMIELKDVQLPNIQLEIEQALKQIDGAKIQQEVQAALKAIDMEKIQQEVKAAMKEVDATKIEAEVKAAMKEVDAAKIQAEIAKAMEGVDMKAIEKELAAAKKIQSEEIQREMTKLKAQLAENKLDLKIELDKATEEMKAAKAKLQLMKEGLNELEKDGLKKEGEKVNIEYKDGIMYLNGAAQSQAISDKYKKYFGDGNFKMD